MKATICDICHEPIEEGWNFKTFVVHSNRAKPNAKHEPAGQTVAIDAWTICLPNSDRLTGELESHSAYARNFDAPAPPGVNEAAETVGGEPKKLVRIPRGRHNDIYKVVNPECFEKCVRETIAWFGQYL